MRAKKFFVKLVLLQFALFIVLFVIFSFSAYMSKIKLQNTFAKELKIQGTNIVQMYMTSMKDSIENIINSYAEWTKMYNKINEKDIDWLKETMGEDVQINSQFSSYGIINSDGTIIYGKNIIFKKKEAKKIVDKISLKYKIGSKMKHPISFYYRYKDKFYIVGISPICSDTGVVLSHDVMFFAKSINDLANIVHKMNRLLSAFCGTARIRGLVCHKLNGLDADTIGYIIIKPSNQFKSYVMEFYSIILYFAAGIILYFVVAVIAFYIFKKTVYGAYENMIECLKGISNMETFECDKIEELSKRKDEIGEMAKKLKYVAYVLKNSIIYDPLTKLFNRRYCKESLYMGVEQAKRYKRPLSVGMLDIDNFKKINDKYGHIAGDRVLECLSEVTKKALRSSDYICRIGGEEFVIVMPETDMEEAKKVAERVREFVEKHECQTNSGIVKITVSIGISSITEQDDYINLLQRADDALYRAKKNGKNMVCVE